MKGVVTGHSIPYYFGQKSRNDKSLGVGPHLRGSACRRHILLTYSETLQVAVVWDFFVLIAVVFLFPRFGQHKNVKVS